MLRRAVRQLLVVGKKLKRPVEAARPFELADQPHLPVEESDAVRLGNRQRFALQIVVAQDEGRDLAGHGMQQRQAFLGRQRADGDRAVDQDLEVDLVIRGIDSRRIVDRVGVDAAAGERIGDAAALGHPEIGALAHHLCPDLAAVDTQRVVGAVADFGMPLLRRLYKSADAAEPEEIDRRAEQFADQLGGGEPIGLDPEKAFHLGADRHRFGAAVEDAAARRDQRRAVIGPARTRQSKKPLALGKAPLRVRGPDRQTHGGGRKRRRAANGATSACRCQTRRPTCRRRRRRSDRSSRYRGRARGNGA